MKILKMNIPQKLILFRLLLVPILPSIAYFIGEKSTPIILILMYLGLISDVLDGIIARNQGISSEKLRRLDSQTDMLFWLSLGISTWILHPNLINQNAIAIWSILIMEIACYAISIIKFKKETCTHAFLSKIWGLTLLVAFTSLIGFNHAGIAFYLAIIFGLISHIDVILIVLLLPKWTHDIPSAYHAYLIRKNVKFKRNKYLND